MDVFLNILEEVFEKDKITITMQDVFRDYEEWDSLALLGLGAMIHSEYNMTIPRSEFEKIQTVGELFDYIQTHK